MLAGHGVRRWWALMARTQLRRFVDVNQLATFDVQVSAFTPTITSTTRQDTSSSGATAGGKHTSAGAGEVTVKSTAGRVMAIVADVPCWLRNGTGNDVWYVPANMPISFMRALNHGTSIILYFTAAGSATVQYV